jgi:hypothetical protein
VKSTPVAYGFLLVGVICVVVAVLYALGVLQLFASTSSGPHYKHAVLFGVLAVASFIAFNFARPKTA